MIKEIIVVEGRDDVTAVKAAVDAEVIAVSGFGINKNTIDKIKEAQKRKGVIILTDPDFAGEKIRRIISKRVEGVKHAYISREEGTKDGDIGVENASPESIREALSKAKAVIEEKREVFTANHLVYYKLVGDTKAKERRHLLGKILGVGYCNGSQMVKRLNNFNIKEEEFVKAMDKIEKQLSK